MNIEISKVQSKTKNHLNDSYDEEDQSLLSQLDTKKIRFLKEKELTDVNQPSYEQKTIETKNKVSFIKVQKPSLEELSKSYDEGPKIRTAAKAPKMTSLIMDSSKLNHNVSAEQLLRKINQLNKTKNLNSMRTLDQSQNVLINENSYELDSDSIAFLKSDKNCFENQSSKFASSEAFAFQMNK